MPPSRKKRPQAKAVCRVCGSEGSVLLEVFGSETQAVSYVGDIKMCLSVEVEKDDGLPSKICIKCVGVLNECRSFVDRAKEVALKRQSDSVVISASSCYFCLCSDNILFPVPETSITKTKYCFNFSVTRKDQICIRCQFLLERLHELKETASETIKELDAVSVKVKQTPRPEESVEDIVGSLKDRLKMDQQVKKPGSAEVSETKGFEIKIIDIGRVLGSDFFNRTISVTEFWKRLGTSSNMNGEVSQLKVKKSGPASATKRITKKSVKLNVKKPVSPPPQINNEQQGLKKNQSPLPVKKSRRLSKCEELSNVSVKPDKKSVTFEENEKTAKKRTQDLNESGSDTVSKQLKLSSESKKSEMSSDMTLSPQTRRSSQASEKKDERAETDTEQDVVSSTVKSADPSPEVKKGSKRSKVKKDKADIEHTAVVPEKSSQPTIVRPVASANKVNEASIEGELDPESTKRKKRGLGMKSFSKFFDDDDDSVKGKRKRIVASEDEESKFSPKNRGRKKQRGGNYSEDIDGSSVKFVSQPAFLTELDELLKFTPTAVFTPFICSVCHEGYVSTVKGKLHKLVVHDPHSNLVLKLTRCDDGPELEKLKHFFTVESQENNSIEEPNFISNNAVPDNEADPIETTAAELPLKKEVEDDDDDDLFLSSIKSSSSNPKSDDMFDALLSGNSDETKNVKKEDDRVEASSTSEDKDGPKNDEIHVEKENLCELTTGADTSEETNNKISETEDAVNKEQQLGEDHEECKKDYEKLEVVEVDKLSETKDVADEIDRLQEETTEMEEPETDKNDQENEVEETSQEESETMTEAIEEPTRDEASDGPESTENDDKQCADLGVDPDKPSDVSESAEMNIKSSDEDKCDSSPEGEAVSETVDEKSPEVPEDQENRGSEADVESNGSAEANEHTSKSQALYSDHEAGENGDNEVDSTTDILLVADETNPDTVSISHTDDVSCSQVPHVSTAGQEVVPVGDV